MEARDLKLILRIVWLVLSAAVVCVLAAPFFLPADAITSLASACQGKGPQARCSLCGMTTAFLLISRGSVREAARANHGSLPLYASFVLDVLLCGFFSMRRPGGSPGG